MQWEIDKKKCLEKKNTKKYNNKKKNKGSKKHIFLLSIMIQVKML